MAFIYVITNQINGKQYVGKTTTSIQQRFQEHCSDSKRLIIENRPLYRAMNKYGTENFKIEELEQCSEKDASDREIFWIGKLDTYHTGYNATFGGDGRVLFDYDAIVMKYLELKNQKDTAKFFNCDTDTIRNACRNKGVKIIPAQEVMRRYGKSVYKIDKQTNEVLEEYESLHCAAKDLVAKGETKCKEDTARTHISEVCRGKQRKSFAGYRWQYAE